MSQDRPPGSVLALLRRTAPFLAPHRWGLLAVVALALSTAALAAAEPLVTKHLFDELTGGRAPARLALVLGGLAGLLVLHSALAAVLDWMTWRVRIAFNFGILQATVERLHALPLAFHREHGVGALMTRIDRGIAGVVGALADVVFNALPAAVYLALSLAVMLRLDWRLALLVSAFAPLPALVGAWAAREQSRRERALLERWTRIFARFNEVLSGILVVKSFAMEDAEKRRFLHGVDEANRLVVRGVATDATTAAVKNTAVALARLAAIGYGGYLVARGRITVGTLVAFLAYIGGLFNPVQALTGIYQTLRRGAVALDAVAQILDAQDSLGDAPDAREAGTLRGEVEFCGVAFGYRPDAPVLRGVDLRVRAGETVALVGPSGSGKSTLTTLLQRLYDPAEGSVRIDGVDLRAFKQRSLRQQIGVVLQEALLFNETVRANIAFGRPGASDAEIEAAARAANAHDFITALPDGYDTVVGERGCRLSGGERQRIAIARALLKDPPILVLDEATSALDAESEALVQEALARLTRGRTTFVVAHRLATVADADRIVVMRDGRIAEQGTHDELLRAGGYYAALVRRQVLPLRAAFAA